MASHSAETDSEATISDMSSSDVPAHEIPPPVLDAEEEEVTMGQPNKEVEVAMGQCNKEVDVTMGPSNKEVEISELLKGVPGIQVQDWRVFAHRRSNGHIDKTYVHKKYRHHFRSKCEVKRFIKLDGIEKGEFDGIKLQKKKISGTDAQDAGTSKSAGRRVSANHGKPNLSPGQSRSINDEERPPGFRTFLENK